MVNMVEDNQKIVRNLCVGLFVALGSTACATSSLNVTEQAAPITYKIDGEAGQYASIRRNIDLQNPGLAPTQRQSSLSPRQIQQPRVSTPPQPRLASPQIEQTPQVEFNPRRVDKQLYAHQSVRNPYKINGVEYTPKHEPNYDVTGLASWYGPKFNGKPTATGEIFDKNDLTAAHKTLALNSMVHVTNLENGRTLMVRINDRVRYAGPAEPNAPKRFYQEPVRSAPAPTPQIAARPQVAPAPVPHPVAPAPQPSTDYVPLRELGGQVTPPPVTQAPQVDYAFPQPPAPTNVAQELSAPVAQAPIAPLYQAPAPVMEVPVSPDRLAPVAPPRPDAGGNVTLTIKGPVHMATQGEDMPQPKWIPAVNRVTKTK